MRLPQCIYMMQCNFWKLHISALWQIQAMVLNLKSDIVIFAYNIYPNVSWRFYLIYRIDIEKNKHNLGSKNLFKFCLFYNHCIRYWLWLHLVRTINFVSVLVDCQKYLGTNNTYLAAQTTTTKVHIINSFMRHIPCHLWYLRSIQF